MNIGKQITSFPWSSRPKGDKSHVIIVSDVGQGQNIIKILGFLSWQLLSVKSSPMLWEEIIVGASSLYSELQYSSTGDSILSPVPHIA